MHDLSLNLNAVHKQLQARGSTASIIHPRQMRPFTHRNLPPIPNPDLVARRKMRQRKTRFHSIQNKFKTSACRINT